MPAAMLVTQEIASTSNPMCRASNYFRDGGHAHEVGANRSQIADFGGRFVARTEHGRIDAFEDVAT